MTSTTTICPPSISKLELRTAYGSVFRDVLNIPPRACTAEEIPIIDLEPLHKSTLPERMALAEEIRAAAVNTGFFYIKNHGIEEEVITNARKQLLAFFRQPTHLKMKVSQDQSKYFNGYNGPKSTLVNNSEGLDVKESLGWRYSPQYDPETKDLASVPPEVKPWIRGEDFVWEGNAHLPNFKEEVLKYWATCLTLARKLVKLIALSLDLEENYFDSRTTYPGADGVFNYYPPRKEEETTNNDIGLGSHTDLQLFTLLWQDMTGGLQILSKEGQWIMATPVEGTIVVNIGDFLMRLCNDTYISTVHRVYNKTTTERVSMPFFFGLNFNCVEGVIPSCVSESNPAKYEPISCGDWCQLRFKAQEAALENREMVLKAQAPNAAAIIV